jgi:hypothetical protein
MSEEWPRRLLLAAWAVASACSGEEPGLDETGDLGAEDHGLVHAGMVRDAAPLPDAALEDASSTDAASPGAIRFDPIPCTFTLPSGHVEGETPHCGQVAVAEQRSPATGTATIAFLALRGREPILHPDPVVMLPGGPGLYAERLVENLSPERIDELGVRRRIIVVEQRGVGRSAPNLDCSELEQGSFSALADCYRRYREAGVDLDAYNSVESAADVDRLRRALGYEQINLWGSSYGSRLAL